MKLPLKSILAFVNQGHRSGGGETKKQTTHTHKSDRRFCKGDMQKSAKTAETSSV